MKVDEAAGKAAYEGFTTIFQPGGEEGAQPWSKLPSFVQSAWISAARAAVGVFADELKSRAVAARREAEDRARKVKIDMARAQVSHEVLVMKRVK